MLGATFILKNDGNGQPLSNLMSETFYKDFSHSLLLG